METVNNMAAAAAKAVWGENNTKETSNLEPISGQQGDVSKGEPFDKGNVNDATATAAATGTAKTTEAPAAEFAKTSGTAAESDKVPDNPSTELKSKDTPADTTEGQNDVRDPEDPKTNPKNQLTDVDNTGEGPNEGQKLEGAGPKPLAEAAKEHGGEAGNSATNVDKTAGEKHAAPTAGEEDKDGPNAKSTGEGSGEQWIKTTGLQADGGDFDATKAGAGREADRLLEEKGIKTDNPDAKPEAAASGDSVDSAGKDSGEKKKSPLAKIKEKLHKH